MGFVFAAVFAVSVSFGQNSPLSRPQKVALLKSALSDNIPAVIVKVPPEQGSSPARELTHAEKYQYAKELRSSIYAAMSNNCTGFSYAEKGHALYGEVLANYDIFKSYDEQSSHYKKLKYKEWITMRETAINSDTRYRLYHPKEGQTVGYPSPYLLNAPETARQIRELVNIAPDETTFITLNAFIRSPYVHEWPFVEAMIGLATIYKDGNVKMDERSMQNLKNNLSAELYYLYDMTKHELVEGAGYEFDRELRNRIKEQYNKINPDKIIPDEKNGSWDPASVAQLQKFDDGLQEAARKAVGAVIAGQMALEGFSAFSAANAGGAGNTVNLAARGGSDLGATATGGRYAAYTINDLNASYRGTAGAVAINSSQARMLITGTAVTSVAAAVTTSKITKSLSDSPPTPTNTASGRPKVSEKINPGQQNPAALNTSNTKISRRPVVPARINQGEQASTRSAFVTPNPEQPKIETEGYLAAESRPRITSFPAQEESQPKLEAFPAQESDQKSARNEFPAQEQRKADDAKETFSSGRELLPPPLDIPTLNPNPNDSQNAQNTALPLRVSGKIIDNIQPDERVTGYDVIDAQTKQTISHTDLPAGSNLEFNNLFTDGQFVLFHVKNAAGQTRYLKYPSSIIDLKGTESAIRSAVFQITGFSEHRGKMVSYAGGFVYQFNYRDEEFLFGATVAHTVGTVGREITVHMYDPLQNKTYIYDAKIAAVDKNADIAIFRIPRITMGHLIPLQLALRGPENDMSLDYYGYPEGKFISIKDKQVLERDKYTIYMPYKFPEVDSKGACGGPLLDQDNKVRAMHTGSTDDKAISYGTSVDNIYRLTSKFLSGSANHR